MSNEIELKYKANPTLRRFHRSNALYRGIRGPVRSGKSIGCSWEGFRRATMQEPWHGVRRSKLVVVRNTYRELKDTTMASWLRCFPENVFGAVRQSDMVHELKMPLDNGTTMDLQVLFRALDRPQDVSKLLSLEVSWGWINEAREVPKGVIDILGDRVGQYPPKDMGGCTWAGVWMDTNSPDDDHWWYRLAEVDRPDNWEFFAQPGGLMEVGGEFLENPAAENVKNLNDPHYYLNRLGGKSADYVRVYYCNQYGFVRDGKPVIPEYVDALHCREIAPNKAFPVIVGVDFGLTPAAVFAQQDALGRWNFVDELATEDMGAVRFAAELKRKLASDFDGFAITAGWGDPAGEQRAQTDETTPFQILAAAGLDWIRPAPTNDFTIRRESMATALNTLVDGRPRLLISPKCKVVRKGLAGAYCYRRLQVSGDERYQDKPEKNRYSHPIEAGQYALVGQGEGRMLVRRSEQEAVRVRIPYFSDFSDGAWMGM